MKRNGSGYSQADHQVLSCHDAQRSVQDAPPNNSPGAEKIAQSITYMMQHLDQPLQVATLAATVNVSPSHFFALFKRRIGSAPMDYFTRLRMQRACRSLEQTSLSVKEIASELGYDDPFYFSRVFKSVNRMSPSDYRAAQRGMAGKTKEDGEVTNFPRAPKAASVTERMQFAGPRSRLIYKYE